MEEEFSISTIKSTKKWKILVTPKEVGESLKYLPGELLKNVELIPTGGRISDTEKLIDLLNDKEAVVLDLEAITSETLKRCANLKIISRFGEGCDAIDLESAKNNGVRVAKTRAVSSFAVARHTMSLILALTHRITENDRNLKNGIWKRTPNVSDESATLGIIGCGEVGKAVAGLSKAFGFRIIIYSNIHSSPEYEFAGSLEELVEKSEIVSLHLPLTSETRNIISKDMVETLKGKYLVNTARGKLVDEEAVLYSLDINEMLGYATDVFLREPISGISGELAMHPKVICTPHISALDKNTNAKVTERAVTNALHCLNHEHEKVISYVV